MPDVISDAMVLQRDRSVPIWGWADPGEIVTVGFAGTSSRSDGLNLARPFKAENVRSNIC